MSGIACPQCGGKMFYDIAGKHLKCPFCSSTREIEDYDLDNEAEVQKDTYSTLVYTCKNCGAELVAPDEQVVAYCSYCGSEEMLSGKHEDIYRPKTIIPFQKTKKAAKSEYERVLKSKIYTPKEFKDANFIEGFRGIYVPYYSYEAVIPEKTISIDGQKNYTRGSYDYHEEYDLKANIGGVSKRMTFDASSAFDDTIANEIAPFDMKDSKPFSDAYLAGFYADKATTPVDTYIEDATKEAVESVYREIRTSSGGVVEKSPKTYEEKKEEINIDSFNCDVSFFPVWFLTWRHKDRVAYSVMNGQTGALSADIPVDKKKFFLVSAAAAAILFIILSLLPVFILPTTLSVICGIILVISSIVFSTLITRIYEKEKHIYDLGDILHSEKKVRIYSKEPKVQTKKSSGGKTGLAILVLYGIFYVIAAIAGIADGISSCASSSSSVRVNFVLFIIMIIISIIFSIKIISKSVKLDNKKGVIPALFAPAALLFAAIVSLFAPAHDMWYYGISLALLAGLILNGLFAMNYFNYLVTRPVPNFFTREGADNDA